MVRRTGCGARTVESRRLAVRRADELPVPAHVLAAVVTAKQLGESVRQFQASLEYRRRARTETDGSVSMLGDLDQIEADHDQEARNLNDLWLRWKVGL